MLPDFGCSCLDAGRVGDFCRGDTRSSVPHILAWRWQHWCLQRNGCLPALGSRCAQHQGTRQVCGAGQRGESGRDLLRAPTERDDDQVAVLGGQMLQLLQERGSCGHGRAGGAAHRLSLPQAQPMLLWLHPCAASHPAPCSSSCRQMVSAPCFLLAPRATVPSAHPMHGRCHRVPPLPCATGAGALPWERPCRLQPVPCLQLPSPAAPAKPSPASPAPAAPWGLDRMQRPTGGGLASPGSAGPAPGRCPGWPQSPAPSGSEALPCCFSSSAPAALFTQLTHAALYRVPPLPL